MGLKVLNSITGRGGSLIQYPPGFGAFQWLSLDGLWSDAYRWAGGVVPTTGDAPVFNAFVPTGNQNVYLNGARACGLITINNPGSTTFLGGTSVSPASNTLTLSAGITLNLGCGNVVFGDGVGSALVPISLTTSQSITDNSANDVTFYNNISSAGGTLTITNVGISGTGTTTLAGVISNGAGTTALTVSSAGKTVLSGNNTYTGTGTFNGTGFVVISGNNSGSSANVFLNASNVVQLTGSLMTGTFTTASNAGFMNSTGSTLNLNNAATGFGSSLFFLGNNITYSNSVTGTGNSTYTAYGFGNVLTLGAYNGGGAAGTTLGGSGDITISGILSNNTGLNINNYGTTILNGSNTFGSSNSIILVNSGAQSYIGMIGSVVANGASPFGSNTNIITWTSGSGGNGAQTVIYFKCDSASSPVSYRIQTGNNGGNAYLVYLDTATASAGYSRSFTIGDGSTTGVFSSSNAFIVKQGPTATSAITFNVTNNAYSGADGTYVPLMNDAATYGVAMSLTSVSITLNTARGINFDGNTTGNTVVGALNNSGTGSLNIKKFGISTWTFSGAAGTMSGGFTVSGGTVIITGAVASNALAFSGSGTINFSEAAGSTQSMGALSSAAGEAVIQSTYAGSGSSTLTFSSNTALTFSSNATSGVMNYIATNGTSNKIVLTGNTGNRFLNNSATASNTTGGYFFGGSNYAYYDTGSYVRGVNWGVDANTATYAGGTNFTNPAGTTKLQQITGTVTNQTASTVLGHLNISGSGVDLTLAGQIQLWGILKSGTGSSTISGGTIVAGASGGLFFFRADLASDVLNINSPIVTFGTNGINISGAGTVSFGVVHTGVLGWITIGGGATLKLTTNGALGSNYANSPLAGGATPGTQTVSIFGGKLDVYGNSTSCNAINSSPGSILDNSLSSTPVNIRIAGGTTAAGAITNTGAPLTMVLAGNATFLFGIAVTSPYGYSWQTNTYSGGTYLKGANAGGGTITVAKQNCLGTGPVWLGDVGYGAAPATLNLQYLTTTRDTFSNNNTFYLQQDVNLNNVSLDLGAGTFYLTKSLLLGITSANQTQGPFTIRGNITDGPNTYSLTFNGAGRVLYTSGNRWDARFDSFNTGSGGILILGGNNTFKGGLTTERGSVMAIGETGTPFGVGNITIQGTTAVTSYANASSLIVNPIYPAGANISALTTSDSTLSFSGIGYLAFNNQSGGVATLTLGSGSAQTVFTRVNRGILVITDATAATYLGGSSRLMLASGTTVPTITNGMLPAYFISPLGFMTYNSSLGFVPALPDLIQGSFAGSTERTKIQVNGTPTVTGNDSAYSIYVLGPITINSGARLTVGDGVNPAGINISASRNIVGVDATSTLAFRGSEGVITLGAGNCTISATITGTNGVTFGVYNSGSGTFTLTQNPGWTGPLRIHSNTLIFGGGGFTMPGAIEGPGNISFGQNGTITLNQSAGTHYIGSFVLSATTATVVFAGAGSTNIFSTAAWAWTGTPTLQITSGTWYIPSTSNSGNNAPGTITVNGGIAVLQGGRYWQSAGGTTNVSSGTLFFGGDRWNPGESANISPIVINLSGTGLIDVALNGFNTNIGGAGGASMPSVTFNITGGTYQGGMSLSVGSASTGGNFSVGNTTRAAASTVNLKGGLFRLAGTVSSAGAAFAGGSNNWNWSGGTLICGTFNATNLTCGDGVATPATGTLFQSGFDAISNLSPGDVWTQISQLQDTVYQWPGIYSGKTTITGTYLIDTAANASNLVINLSGTTQASIFHDIGIGKYDFVSVSSFTTLGGNLNLILNPLPGFCMATTSTLNALTSTGNVTGTLANVARAGTITIGDITFTVNYPNTASGSIAVTVANAAAINQWSGTSGSNWTTAGSWSNSIIPGSSNTYTARFMDGPAATGAISVVLDANETINGIGFNSITRNYTISTSNGSAITLDATGYTAAGTGFTGIPAAINAINSLTRTVEAMTNTISANIVLNSDVYINSAIVADTLTLSGNISGSGKSMSIFGGGMVVLSGTNSFSGAVNILGGTSALTTGLRADSAGALAGVTAFNFHNQYAILLLNFQANFSTSAPIMVIPNNGGAFSGTNSPAFTSYIGKRGISTNLGANTITFSGDVTLVGYTTLSIQPNSTSGGTYIFSGNVNGRIYQLNINGVVNGTTGAGLFFTPTNGVTIKMTGNIGNGIADQPIIPMNCQMLPTAGSSVWMGASGKTVNLYNLYWSGQTAASTTTSKLVMDGDITCYALYNTTNTNVIPQIAANASSGTNALRIRGSQDMKFQGILGGSGNENNLTLDSRVGGPFMLTLGAVNSFTGGLIVGNGGVMVSTFDTSSAAATWTAGITAITVPSTAGLLAGMTVTGTGIPASSYIAYIASATTFFINGTTTGSGATISFGAGTSMGGSTNTITLGNTETNESGKLVLNGGGQSTTIASIAVVGSGTANAIVGGAATNSTLVVTGTIAPATIFGGPWLYESNIGLTWSNSGTQQLAANSNLSGDMIISGGGTLQVIADINITATTNTIDIQNGTLDLIGSIN
jgi:fibronectin-binding autotransporter adhesin